MTTILPRGWVRGSVVLALAGFALSQTGCKGCDREAGKPQTAAQEGRGPAGLPGQATATQLPEGATPAEAAYQGPRSESVEGWRITTGFATTKDEPLTAVPAFDRTKVFVTVLDPQGRPVGRFDRLERGEMHGFLVARDMRQALYSVAKGPLREGADARVLEFQPGEGGDHAIVTVFRPAGKPPVVVSTPITIKGALPEVMGPGVAGLSNRAEGTHDKLHLTTVPAQPVATRPVELHASEVASSGQTGTELKLPFVVVMNDQMGIGQVVEWDANGRATWTPQKPGTYLVLAPPTQGERALAFKLVVTAPAKPAAGR